ncbi:galactitol-1-phosphate 5-dehydrogenase [Alkalibacter saccharofermentans]|uniref:L-iditol 2-dehydrogenase n=1 Tax=Alkalibacter saccharofermentans DSM 14828 TaxID=1120975 RepID=A0A1M4T7Z2_9FIRM|nr:galactitol-1-phosphate 5-dehydrogenase [Alkalibacter saccharofermentans]SHE40662.1 L-iditol 2-dehydrogenase [Alkalibacter saccharofermentans DSM 14828]
MGKMKSAVLKEIGLIEIEERDIPSIQKEEVLVKPMVGGICGTDIERMWHTGTWKFPTVLGHEFCGIIEKVGSSVTNVNVGDHVVINPMVTCGVCRYCRSGHQNMCVEYDYLGSRSDGGYQEYVNVAAKNVIKLPQEMPFDLAATIDPLVIGIHTLSKADIQPGNTVCIMGAGPIGNFMVQLAKVYGAGTVIAADLMEEKLDCAKESGADICVNVTKDDIFKVVEEATSGLMADVVIESAGAVQAVENSILVAAKQGRVVFMGTPHRDVTIGDKVFEGILRKELTVKGSWCYDYKELPIDEWQVGIDYLNSGKVKADHMITHRFPLEKAQDAFEVVKTRDKYFNKVLIYINEKLPE